MAQLPEIPDQPSQYQSRELVVPYDKRPEAIRETALIADKQIRDLTNIVFAHKQAIDDRKAVNELFDAASNTQSAASEIKDTNQAWASFQDGMIGAREDIIKNHPNISEVAMDEMSRITDKKLQQFRQHLIVKQNSENQADIAAVIPDTLRQIKEAGDVESRQIAAANGFNFIDRMHSIGALDDFQAEAHKHALSSAIRESEAYQLAISHPDKISQFTPEQLGVGPKRYYELTHVAVGTRETAMKNDKLSDEEQRAQFELKARNGDFADNPSILNGLREHHLITDDTYRYALAFVPPNLRAKNHLNEILDTVNWDNPEDLKAFNRTHIVPNNELSQSDHKYLSGRVQDMLDKLGNPQGRVAEQLHYGLRAYAASIGTGILDNPRYRGPVREQYRALMGVTTKALEHAKDFNELYKIYIDANDKLQEMFGVGKRIVPKDGKPHAENVINNWTAAATDPEVNP